MVFLFIDRRSAEVIVKLKRKTKIVSRIEYFGRNGCAIMKIENMVRLGTPKQELFRQFPILPVMKDNWIIGKGNSYGIRINTIITNIGHNLLEEIRKLEIQDLVQVTKHYR